MLRAAGVICTALCAAGCGEVHARLSLGPARPVAVAIDGPPGALYAPLYAAQANGDFADGVLAVKITPAPGGDALAALDDRTATVAVASEPELLAARDAGAPLVAIGALTSEPLDAIVSLTRRRSVNAAGKLAGTTIATDGSPLARAQLATVLAAGHVASARVRVLAVPPSGPVAALTARRHAAAATLDGPWPLEVVALERSRRPATVLALPAAGVPPYSGLVLIVRIGEAHYQGPLLRAFLQSLSRGAQAVAANPAATAATLARIYPRTPASVERAVLAQTAPIAASATATEPFGFENPNRWQAFGNWMRVHGLLRAAPNAGLAITNEFLPGQGPQIVTDS